MANDLIRRHRALTILHELGGSDAEKGSWADGWDSAINEAFEKIRQAPVEDIAPARGKWIVRGGRRYCSNCGERACVTRDMEDFWYTLGTDFCPSCGADMREVKQ